MATLSELPLRWQLFLRTYRWRTIDPVPWTPLPKPLPECRAALVTSAGFSLPDQQPFDESIRGGEEMDDLEDADFPVLLPTWMSA